MGLFSCIIRQKMSAWIGLAARTTFLLFCESSQHKFIDFFLILGTDKFYIGYKKKLCSWFMDGKNELDWIASRHELVLCWWTYKDSGKQRLHSATYFVTYFDVSLKQTKYNCLHLSTRYPCHLKNSKSERWSDSDFLAENYSPEPVSYS